MDKERDIVYKNLSDELKPYFENCDCCSDIVKLRKESKDLQQKINEMLEGMAQPALATDAIAKLQEISKTVSKFSTLIKVTNLSFGPSLNNCNIEC